MKKQFLGEMLLAELRFEREGLQTVREFATCDGGSQFPELKMRAFEGSYLRNS